MRNCVSVDGLWMMVAQHLKFSSMAALQLVIRAHEEIVLHNLAFGGVSACICGVFFT